MNEILVLAGILLILIYFLTKKEFQKIELETTEKLSFKDLDMSKIKNWSANTEKQILFCYKFVKSKIYQKLGTPKDDIIMTTLMFQESGAYVLTKKNYQIKGDGGWSIGYFQIYTKNNAPALQEVNKAWKSNFEINDLYNEDVNILIGSRYFYLCFKRNNNGKDFYEKLWLGAKRYNGGLDETLTSNNPKATTYANRFLKNFALVENVLRSKGLIK